MDRRLVAVCTTATLLILALHVPSVAGTKSKPATEKRPAVIRSRVLAGTGSSSAKTRGAGTAHKCVSCAAKLARNTKGRSVGRNAKNAKSVACRPKNYIDPKIARNYNSALRDMKRAGIKPQVTSLWRSSENQEKLYRCSMSAPCRRANPGIYRALPPGKSLHEAGFAVDMSGIAAGPRGNKRLTPKGRRVVAIMRKNGFKWRYGLADPAHFEADPRKHGYRTVKQAIKRTRTTCQLSLARNKARGNNRTNNKVGANRVQAPARGRVPAEALATRARRHSEKIGL
jgi:LAS superfamily LD-carboxypeptidase LdcB